MTIWESLAREPSAPHAPPPRAPRKLFDDVSGPVGPVYMGRVANAGKELAISVSFLHTAAAGPHTYTLQAMSINTGAPVVTASNAVVTAVDFGQ